MESLLNLPSTCKRVRPWEPMLETISLSEEELGLLFPPASNGCDAEPQDPHAAGDAKLRRLRTASSNTSQRKAQKTSTSRPSRSRTMRNKASDEVSSSAGVVPARCGYRTGKCQNLQAIKRNGTLHKLCEFHRERANLNQKKLDRKKRLQRSSRSSSTAKSPPPSTCESVSSEEDTRSVDSADLSPRTVDASETLASVFSTADPADNIPVLPTSLHEAPLALGCEELAIFCSLMTFDTSQCISRSRDAPPAHVVTCLQHSIV